MTKYPSIPTYHTLNPKNGDLLDETVQFTGRVDLTEKIDGTNARIITMPDGTWFLGSREELLYAEGDLIGNPAQGIVAALKNVAGMLTYPIDDARDCIRIHYLEVYGGKVTANSKQYTRHQTVGWRLFDVAELYDYGTILGWTAEHISGWREGGGQTFLPEDELLALAGKDGLDLVPWLDAVSAETLPTSIQKMHQWMREHLPATYAALDAGGEPGRPEGMVLRATDRSVIAKARFQDYERTLRRRDAL
jgi:hypothetical protein